MSKSQRRRILSTYEAAIPASIEHEAVDLSQEIVQRIAEVSVSIARFDQAQLARGYNLPALLLRSESSSSSQIERLTSSVRNVALAGKLLILQHFIWGFNYCCAPSTAYAAR